MKLPKMQLVAGVILALLTTGGVKGATLIISDDFNVANVGFGFALTNGVNSGINPPTTRLTGLAAPGLRYFRNITDKAADRHTIGTNKLYVSAGTGSSGISLSPGTGAYDFSSMLRTLNASVSLPSVYEIRVKMATAPANTQRFSFGWSSDPGAVGAWDFGIQLNRPEVTNTFYTIYKRVDVNSSSALAADLNSVITTTAPGTWGTELSFLIRVTDAGAETATYSSRVQVSMDEGATWFYDSNADAEIGNQWRLDTAGRYFFFDIPAGGVGTYDDFSITWISGPAAASTLTWSGGGADNNWSTGANWGGTVPETGDKLIFGGSTRPVNTNDLTGLTVPWVAFNNGGFELYGNALVLGSAITNLAGNNTLGLSASWTTAAPKFWQIDPGTELVLTAPMTIDVDGDHNFHGGGTLRVLSSLAIGSINIAGNPAVEVDEARVVFEGPGASFSSVGGWRIGSTVTTTTVAETVISNGANFYLSQAGGAMRVGDRANGVVNRLVVHNSTLQMSQGDMGVPWVAGSTGEVTQVGGLVSGCDLNFNQAGAGVGTYSVVNGVLEPRQIANNNPAGSATISFDNATLRTFTTTTAPFMSRLNVAEIRSGGLKLEATTADVLLESAFSGAGGLTKSGPYAATLTGANTYSGSTVVQEGKLVLPTAHTNAGAIQVAAATELGVLLTSPGTSLTAGSLTFGTSAVTFDLGSFPNPAVALGTVGSLTANGTVTVNLNAGLGLKVGTIKLIDYSGAIGGGGFGSFVKGTLPPGVSATLVNNVVDSSIDLLITGVTVSQPNIGSVTTSDGNIVISGTGGAEGATYHVLSATSVVAPIEDWTPVATNVFGAGGIFSYTNAIGTELERYFRLVIPAP